MYLQMMIGLTKTFAEQEVRLNAARQLEVGIAAVGATREFSRHAVPDTGHRSALDLFDDCTDRDGGRGQGATLFAIPIAKHGRDFARVLVEVNASASVDILHGAPLRLSLNDAAIYVAKILELSGMNFFSRNDVPAHKQVLEWRKRLRSARGTPEHDDYFASIRSGQEGMKHPDFDDPKSAVARALEWLVAGAVSPAHLNKDAGAAD